MIEHANNRCESAIVGGLISQRRFAVEVLTLEGEFQPHLSFGGFGLAVR